MSLFIKQFQKKHNLESDGLIGKQTLLKIKEVLDIPTNEGVCHFVANCHHESMGFSKFEENLNYSSEQLLRTFPKYFKTKTEAEHYHRQPQKIANKVYGGRMGNDQPNDGWKFRGRGALQTTGKVNYTALGKHLKLDLVTSPELILNYVLESAKFFFDSNSLWKLASTVDKVSIPSVRKRVNGGYNGLKEVEELTYKYYKIINN